MITVEVGDSDVHEYASGISAGEVIANVHGRKSGAVAALVNLIEPFLLLHQSPVRH